MIINKFTKTKDGMYKLKLDNDIEVKLHEEIILKYNLLITKNLDESLLLQLEKENIKYEAYNLTLKYLKNRQRCDKEIYNYLKSKGISDSNIDFVINILTKQGYLNDEVYITSYINYEIDDTDLKQKEYDKLYKKYSKKYSGYELEYKIKQGLYQKGFR